MVDITYTEAMVSDLRDSAGHTLKLLNVTGISGTYSYGGVRIDPSDVGFSTIEYIQVQPYYPIPLTYPGPWFSATMLSVVRIDAGKLAATPYTSGVYEWRMLVMNLITSPGTAIAEIDEGTSLSLPYGDIQMLVIGSE